MQVKLTIGERLKDLRTAQKLTLEQLAAEVGISKSAPVSYTHLTLPTTSALCRSRWSPYH